MVIGSPERVVTQITQGPGWARKSFQKEVLKDKSVKGEREESHVLGALSYEKTGRVQGTACLLVINQPAVL